MGPLRELRRHPLVQMLVIGAIASIIGIVAVLAIDWFPAQASTAAGPIDLLYDWLLVASVPIFVLTMTVAIYSVVRFRARPGDTGDGAPIHGNTRLEVVWVAIPFFIVSALAVYGWVVLDDIEARQPDALVVNVTGQQFAWRFQYPQGGGRPPIETNDLVLPIGRQVDLKIRASDVIHSFWVPAFRMKQDAVPGLVTETRVTPTRPGSFPLVCAELCGVGHSTMRQTVRVVSGEEFTSWLDQRNTAVAASSNSLDAGRTLYNQQGCAGCHTLADARSQAATGPPLDGLSEVAEKRNPDQTLEEYIRESIVAPEALVVRGYPRRGMPANYGERLSGAEVETLVRYLASTSESSTGEPAQP